MVGVSPKVQSRAFGQLRLRLVLSAAPGFTVPKEADSCWKGDPPQPHLYGTQCLIAEIMEVHSPSFIEQIFIECLYLLGIVGQK